MDMDEEVKYKHGHTAIPNGVGDFDFICPKNGKIRFIPIFLRERMRGVCSCGVKIELEPTNI